MSRPGLRSVSRRALLKVGGGLLLPISACAGKARADWPCFRGPNRNGILDERLTLRPGGPQKLWEVQVGHGNASMALSNARLYTVSSGDPSMLCLDAASGRTLWKLRVEDHFGNPTPSVEGDRVYGMASTGKGVPTAYCWAANDGRQIWMRELPASTGDRQYGHAGSTLLCQDLVILNAGAGAALKKATGEIVWSHPGFPGLATPVLFQSKGVPSVTLFGGDRLIAREARTGRELWQIPWKTELAVNACDPILFDNKVFISSDYGRGRALYDVGGAQPRKLWEYPQGGGSSYSSGFYHQGNLYTFAENSLVRLDIATGRPVWRTGGGDSAILIGDTLVVVHPRGGLLFGRLTAAGVDQPGYADTGMRALKAVPAYSGGRLYLRSETGKLACFQIGMPA